MNPDPQVPRAPTVANNEAAAAVVATSASAAEFSWLEDAMEMLRDEDGSDHPGSGACLGPADTGPSAACLGGGSAFASAFAFASASAFLPLFSSPPPTNAAPALTARARIAASVGGCVDDFDALTCLAGEGFFPPPPSSSSYHWTNTNGAFDPATAEPPSAPFWEDATIRAAPENRRASAASLPPFHPVVKVEGEDEGEDEETPPNVATATTERRRSADRNHLLQIEALANSVRRRFSSSTRKKKKKASNPAAEAAALSMETKNKKRRISALFGAAEDATGGAFPSSAEALFPSVGNASDITPRRSVRTIFRSRLRTSFDCDDDGDDDVATTSSDSSASASDTASLSSSSHLETLVSSMQRSGCITLNPAHPSAEIAICNNDVICGTGTITSSLIGNRRFEVLVDLHQRSYDIAADGDGRGKVAKSLVDTVRGSVPSGRFIKLDMETGLWGEVGDDAARIYSEEALRGRGEERDTTATSADSHCRQSSTLLTQSASVPVSPLPTPSSSPLLSLSVDFKGNDRQVKDIDGNVGQSIIISSRRGILPLQWQGSIRAMAA